MVIFIYYYIWLKASLRDKISNQGAIKQSNMIYIRNNQRKCIFNTDFVDSIGIEITAAIFIS